MPRRSDSRLSRHEKNDGGCISGLRNMFEFRHSRLNRKLLSTTEHVNNQNIGPGSSSETPTLQNSTKKKGKNPKNLEGAKTNDFVKTSVKKLMEEDMVNEQHSDKPINLSKGSPEEFNSNHRNARKDSRLSSRTSRSSIDMDICNKGSLKSVDPKHRSQQMNEHKTSEVPNLQTLIQELSQIHSRSTDCINDGLDADIHLGLEQDHIVIPDKLSAAIKVIISERHLEEDDKASHSGVFMDALETINSNKQVLLKLLEDSNSQLLKQRDGSERVSLKNDQKSNSLRESTISNETPTRLEPRKPRKFFRKRSKSLDSFPLIGDETGHSSSKIVILKPGLSGSRLHDHETRKSSFSNMHDSIQDKVQGDRHSSYFFFTEIKRKLQHAIGKEHRGVTSFKSSEYRDDTDKGPGGDNHGWRSPNRNHFYTEVFATPSPGFRRDSIEKSKDAEPASLDNTSGHLNQGVSDIYIEAKKHLSEMLKNGEDNLDSVQRQSPKSLGGILSLPAYKDLSAWSREEDIEDSFITARTILSTIGPSQGINHSPQHDQDEGDAYISSSEKNIGNQIDMVSENIHEKERSPDSNCGATCELKHENTMEGTRVSIEDVVSSKYNPEAAESAQTPIQESDKILNDLVISVNMYPDKEDVDNDNAAICNGNPSSKCSDADSIEDGQQSPSFIATPLSSNIGIKVEDTEIASDRTHRYSPISVLEPLFSDDEISPPRSKDRQVEGDIRPKKIHFEEEIYSVRGVGISAMSVLEDGESPFDYVEAVLLGSDLNWDDFLLRWLSSDQILDPSVFQEVELFSSRHNDQKLLFDCTNEVLKEVCDRYFGFFVGASFNRQTIQPAPKGMNLINEIWEGVEWYLFQHLPSKSLDQLVESDMKRSRIWMDIRLDIEHIGIEIEAAILENLLEDTVGSFLDDNSVAGTHETEISIESQSNIP